MRKVKNWYAQSRAKIKELYGADWKLFTGIVAATSAHTSLSANITLAKKAYEQVKQNNLNPTEFMGSHYLSIKSMLETGKPRGQKSQAFFANLCGDENQVTVDIWMSRLYRGNSKAPTPLQYARLAKRIRAEAKLLGMSPAQYQAEQWIKVRGKSQSLVDFL